jgi:hypothetical protein
MPNGTHWLNNENPEDPWYYGCLAAAFVIGFLFVVLICVLVMFLAIL